MVTLEESKGVFRSLFHVAFADLLLRPPHFLFRGPLVELHQEAEELSDSSNAWKVEYASKNVSQDSQTLKT